MISRQFTFFYPLPVSPAYATCIDRVRVSSAIPYDVISDIPEGIRDEKEIRRIAVGARLYYCARDPWALYRDADTIDGPRDLAEWLKTEAIHDGRPYVFIEGGCESAAMYVNGNCAIFHEMLDWWNAQTGYLCICKFIRKPENRGRFRYFPHGLFNHFQFMGNG